MEDLTPDQKRTIADCVTRLRNMMQGGQSLEFAAAGLIAEGWPAAAVEAAKREVAAND